MPSKNKKPNGKLAVFLLLVVFVFAGFGCRVQDSKTKEAMKPITLTYWRVWDSQKDFQSMINGYKAIHPNVQVVYRNIRFEEFEEKLLEAMAEGDGPDMFSIHSSWIPDYRKRISPMPAKISMAYQYVKKSLGVKEEVLVEYRTTRSITPEKVKEQFAGPVFEEVVHDGQIYGLPLGLDTLAMYYNIDLLNNAGFPEPAQNWADLQKQAPDLTRQNAEGRITQSAVALGGGSNVERYFDILSLLMMQNGAQMMSSGLTRVTMADNPISRSGDTPPGEDALRFYTEFSNPSRNVYTWNKNKPNSLDSFVQGNLAYFFGYAYHQPTIRARAPKLNFGLAPMLQISGNSPINYANYWVETVSARSKNKEAAWDFIQYMAKEENVKSHLEATGKPTALRSLYNKQRKDLDVGIFAEQILTAQNWYRGRGAAAAEKFFKEMIEAVGSGVGTEEAILDAAKKIQQTL